MYGRLLLAPRLCGGALLCGGAVTSRDGPPHVILRHQARRSTEIEKYSAENGVWLGDTLHFVARGPQIFSFRRGWTNPHDSENPAAFKSPPKGNLFSTVLR